MFRIIKKLVQQGPVLLVCLKLEGLRFRRGEV